MDRFLALSLAIFLTIVGVAVTLLSTTKEVEYELHEIHDYQE